MLAGESQGGIEAASPHSLCAPSFLLWRAAALGRRELFIAEQRNVVTDPSWLETLLLRLEPSLGDRMGSGGKLDVEGL